MQRTRVLVIEKLIPSNPSLEPTHLVGNEALDFRAAVGTFPEELEGPLVSLEQSLAEALRVQPGDKISLTSLR